MLFVVTGLDFGRSLVDSIRSHQTGRAVFFPDQFFTVGSDRHNDGLGRALRTQRTVFNSPGA